MIGVRKIEDDVEMMTSRAKNTSRTNGLRIGFALAVEPWGFVFCGHDSHSR